MMPIKLSKINPDHSKALQIVAKKIIHENLTKASQKLSVTDKSNKHQLNWIMRMVYNAIWADNALSGSDIPYYYISFRLTDDNFHHSLKHYFEHRNLNWSDNAHKEGIYNCIYDHNGNLLLQYDVTKDQVQDALNYAFKLYHHFYESNGVSI